MFKFINFMRFQYQTKTANCFSFVQNIFSFTIFEKQREHLKVKHIIKITSNAVKHRDIYTYYKQGPMIKIKRKLNLD